MKNGIFAAAAIILLLAVGVLLMTRNGGTGGGKTDPAETNKVATSSVVRSLERKPLEPEATKRLAEGPQEICTLFEATGKGSWREAGLDVTGRYKLTALVKAISTVDTVKEETARGNFEVTEVREFTEVRDQLVVSDTDIGFALHETLPLDTVAETVKGIAAIIAMFNPPLGTGIAEATAMVQQALKTIDGNSVRGLLGKLGIKIPEDVQPFLDDLITQYTNDQLKEIKTKVHSIEGKSYKIVYLQDKEGAPLRVDFSNIDGSAIEEDEWEILKLANVFIDAQVIPDKRVSPGDKWTVDAETIQGLVDPVCEGGSCSGSISVERRDDLENGDWELKIHPSKILTKKAGGKTVGEFQITDGVAVGDGGNAFVKNWQIVGNGCLASKKTSKRWAIFEFMTGYGTECEFRAIMTTNRAK